MLYQSRTRLRKWTAVLVADALAGRDKVLHRASDPAPLLRELGSAGATARASGQLDVIDPHRCHEQTDGLHWALRQLHEDMIRKAFDEGYPGVVLTADEHALRVMTPEPAERLAHEHDLERLTLLPGVRALCGYDLDGEQPDLLDAVAGLHYRGIDDALWSARLSGDRLLVRGEIDADNAGRFAAALRGAASHGVHTVDLAEVTVLSAAGVRAFDAAVELLRRRDERLRLVNGSPAINRALALLRVANDHRIELADSAAAPGLPSDDHGSAGTARSQSS